MSATHKLSTMGRSKLKKKKKLTITSSVDEDIADAHDVPIPNLPKKFIWMKVKSGTKMKNVLDYSLKEFSTCKSVVWSGTGQAVGKVISCAEIFKRKISGLHQITKLRYVKSKSQGEKNGEENKEIDRRVPEIHILLSEVILDTNEPGYQAPGVCSMFQNETATEKSKDQDNVGATKTRMSSATAEEFAAMGLRTGQKRPRRDNQNNSPLKKNKKKSNGDGNK